MAQSLSCITIIPNALPRYSICSNYIFQDSFSKRVLNGLIWDDSSAFLPKLHSQSSDRAKENLWCLWCCIDDIFFQDRGSVNGTLLLLFLRSDGLPQDVMSPFLLLLVSVVVGVPPTDCLLYLNGGSSSC